MVGVAFVESKFIFDILFFSFLCRGSHAVFDASLQLWKRVLPFEVGFETMSRFQETLPEKASK